MTRKNLYVHPAASVSELLSTATCHFPQYYCAFWTLSIFLNSKEHRGSEIGCFHPGPVTQVRAF
jgi:hypothetical protein